MDKMDRIRAIRNKMRESREKNPELLDEIEIVKEKRVERIQKSKNQRTKEKYAFKKAQLLSEISEENPLELPKVDESIDFSDFSETLKAEAMSFKNKRRGILEDKREYKANKELKRLAKIKRTNEHIVKEGVRFIKHLIPLVNVSIDMQEVEQEYQSILEKFQNMEEMNRTPIVQFKKAYSKWLEERSKCVIAEPVSAKAMMYKAKYNFHYEENNEEIEYDDEVSDI